MDSRKKYDYAVIGAGLTGAVVAKGLSRQGAKVILLEATDLVNESVEFDPLNWTEDSEKNLEFFQLAIGMGVAVETESSVCRTFESGNIKEFLGFGQEAPDYHQLITPFLSPKLMRASPETESWVSSILWEFSGDLTKKSYVTGFQFESDRITGLTINGQTKIQADQIVFAGSLPLLSELIPAEQWNPKVLSKFSKLKMWTAVGIDFQHEFSSENDLAGRWVLRGTPQDFPHPCVGEISKDLKTSRWMTWIPDQDGEDEENIGLCLKRIKRQIKQFAPQLIDGISFEKIYLSPAWGTTSPTQNCLPEFSNLHFCCRQLASVQGVLGEISIANQTLKNMGFTEAAFPAPQIQDSEASEAPSEDSQQETANVSL